MLPSTLLWRIPPTTLRGTGKWPSLRDHVSCISKIVRLYPGSLAPRLVYYPDIEAAYASLWGPLAKAEPTTAVTQYMPLDFAMWNNALRLAGVAPFPEIILEVDQAPIAKPVPPALVSKTMLQLRRHPT